MPSYLDLINLFNEYDREQRLSDGATRLYIKLLDVANDVSRNRPKGAPWIVDFQRSDGYMASVCGWSKNTVKQHRKELVERGLVSGDFGQAGRNSSGKYHLCSPAKNVSTSDTIGFDNVSDVDTIPAPIVSTSDTISPESPLNGSLNVSNVDTLYKEKEKVVVEAASAATPPPALTSEKSESKAIQPRKPSPRKVKGATHEEIAALPLPFDGAEFAEAWRTFYTTNTKQAGKAITAFELMLKKMGAKYPEAFAVLMIEKAIMGNWQGIENAGTARDFTDWQAEQARRPAPPPSQAGPPIKTAPTLNPQAVAENQARAATDLAQRQKEFQARQQPTVA